MDRQERVLQKSFVVSLKLRRRRWLILAQGWSAATTLGSHQQKGFNPEKGLAVGEPFQGLTEFICIRSQGCRCAPTLG